LAERQLLTASFYLHASSTALPVIRKRSNNQKTVKRSLGILRPQANILRLKRVRRILPEVTK